MTEINQKNPNTKPSNGKSSITTLGILCAIIAVVAFIAFRGGSEQSGDSSARDGSLVAESAAYTDMDGNPFDFEQFEGDILVVNSWASWCPFCVNELPDFALLAAEYEDRGVTVVAINRKEEVKKARGFLGTLSGVEGIQFVLDPTDFFYRSIGGFTMPETIFYDRAGNVVVHKQGFMSLSEMRTHTEAALAASDITP